MASENPIVLGTNLYGWYKLSVVVTNADEHVLRPESLVYVIADNLDQAIERCRTALLGRIVLSFENDDEDTIAQVRMLEGTKVQGASIDIVNCDFLIVPADRLVRSAIRRTEVPALKALDGWQELKGSLPAMLSANDDDGVFRVMNGGDDPDVDAFEQAARVFLRILRAHHDDTAATLTEDERWTAINALTDSLQRMMNENLSNDPQTVADYAEGVAKRAALLRKLGGTLGGICGSGELMRVMEEAYCA